MGTISVALSFTRFNSPYYKRYAVILTELIASPPTSAQVLALIINVGKLLPVSVMHNETVGG